MSTPTITDEQIAEIEDGIPCGRTIGHGACGELGFICARCEQSASLISRLRAAERDAARFVFQHTNHEAMLKVEIAALKAAADIDWYRNAIDAAMALPEPNPRA